MGRERKGHQAATVAAAPAESERRPDSRQGGLRPAGISAARITAPIVARHGGGVLARLKVQWAAVVGAELAATTWPEAFGRDGALRLRVASTIAIELQHRTPLVIERINLFLGREAVARLVLVQGPLPLPTPAATPPTLAPLGREEAEALDLRLGAIADPELRAALVRLGRLVLAGARRDE